VFPSLTIKPIMTWNRSQNKLQRTSLKRSAARQGEKARGGKPEAGSRKTCSGQSNIVL